MLFSSSNFPLFRPLFLGVVFIILACFEPGKCSKPNSEIEENSKGTSQLKRHSEIHQAKNLVDTLSFKLRLNLKTYQTRYSSSKQLSSHYLAQSVAVQNEIKQLNKLKHLLNQLAGQTSSTCEKFYSKFGFTASRPIVIKTTSSALPKHYTAKVQVNHRLLIDSGSAMSNGNDLRIFYNKPGDCQGREIDRIVENMGTSKAMVRFKLQEEIGKNITETSSYFLAYGNQYARGAKENPNNVYLFYDDFSDASLGKWYRNWASTAAINGKLEMKTGQTPTGDNGEVAIFVKDGEEWKDIEVELDMMEKNNDKYPGPFLRIEDARLKSTTAWWFEYHSGSTECTMRPFKNNKDGNWLYKGTLAKPLTVGKWVRVKYRVVSDSFSHWVNGHLIHNNVKVSSTWMIAKGTLGLGCHKVASSSGCHTFYDNIKVTQYVSSQPTVFLSSECKVNVKLLYEFGTSEKNPAWSCKQIHDISLHNGQHRLQNGVYWIKTAADQSVPTYCDLVNGGWTLVGKISGQVGNIYSTWLVKNHHVNRLTNPSLTSTNQMSCIDARYLATYHASTVMLASGENSKGIGGKWVQWSLPANRESKSLWTHAVGLKNVTKLEMLPVMVKAWNGGQKLCYQNKYGIMPLPQHGGSYPSVSFNNAGNTEVNDYCMAIGVQTKGTTADGWHQNGNGYDSARSNGDWPNKSYNHGSPFVTVWLK